MSFGAGSRRRSAPQVPDLIDTEGLTSLRLFTLLLYHRAGDEFGDDPIAGCALELVSDFVQRWPHWTGGDYLSRRRWFWRQSSNRSNFSGRRRGDLVWINVTSHPTAEWIARQITEAFPWNEAPHYLIRDRDRIYGAVVTRRLRAMGIRDRPTAPASPWQNGFAERLIGSIRRECVDHFVVLGEAHLRRILRAYSGYTPLTSQPENPLG